jgi:hypothetical protein
MPRAGFEPATPATKRPQTYALDQWYSTGGTRRHLRGYVDYTICITCIMYQQLWGYKVEKKLYLGVREQKRLHTTALDRAATGIGGYVYSLQINILLYTYRLLKGRI